MPNYLSNNIFISLVFNIGFLVLIVTVMSRTKLIKSLIYRRGQNVSNQVMLAIFFGIISILSTYTGIGMNGAIVNTRVIGVLSAGLIGGPITGIAAGVIGGLHRWLFDLGGFTAVACGISTIVAGFIGGAFHKEFQKGDLKGFRLIFLAASAEIIQMAIILVLAKPYSSAIALVKVIAMPMVLLNSCGIIAFIGAFDHIFVEQNSLADSRIRLAFQIAEQCLPYLRKGLSSQTDLKATVDVIRALSGCAEIAITDLRQVLAASSENASLTMASNTKLPSIVASAIAGEGTCVEMPSNVANTLQFLLNPNQEVTIATPILQKGKPVGCLMLTESPEGLSLEAQVGFLEGLSKLFATQLELAGMEYQKKLLQKAEFQMLQTQVNPHFLFNSLNTISCFCREKPERARELLLILADYYRYAVNRPDIFVELSSEVEQVKLYLELEQARFEDRLKVRLDTANVPKEGYLVPSLILQPIVENAIKHGAEQNGIRDISLTTQKEVDGIHITVKDTGNGFEPDVLLALESGKMPKDKVGLSNVHNRLKNIYGEDRGLKIATSNEGAEVTMIFSPLENTI